MQPARGEVQMKSIILVMLVAAVLAVVAVPRWSGLSVPAFAAPAEKEALTFYMDHLRRLTHKLGLAIDAKNPALASFYASEITEFQEVIKTKFPQYEGFQIAALMTAMLSPQVTVLTQTIGKKDWNKASADYDNMLTAGCNGCHAAVQRPFIKIVRSKTNPYNQDFSP
jgi:hypothetical protein